jgi:peptidoglycan/LPS O-acetylase OafA/YrhL
MDTTTRPAPAPVLAPPPPALAPGAHGFRSDIEGLRGVAVLLVLLYHAGLPWLPGGYVGVDVFFVLSGYLITRGLASELGRTGTVRIVTFYARRFRRLLPASTLVLVVTVLAARVLASPMVAESVARDGLWSAGWLANHRFISVGLDYLATDQAESPLLHFWSLAVEEQFYVLWPLLLVAVAKCAGSGRTRPLAAVLGAVTVVSFAWAVHTTAGDPTVAYLSLPTRAWEMSAGGLLALVSLRPSVRAGRWLAFGGLAVVVASAATFDQATAFPGPMALLPVAATAGVIWAGASASSPARVVLDRRLLQRAGKLSYSLYLWHWPLLILGEHAAARPLTGGERAGLLVASWVLAELSLRLVEDPLRHAKMFSVRPRRAVGFGLSLAASALAVSFVAASYAPVVRAVGRVDADLQAAMGGLDDAAPEVTSVGSRLEASDASDDLDAPVGEADAPADLDHELDSILAAAAVADAVPAGLDPQLDAAGDEVARIYDDGCVIGEPEADCTYGDRDADRTMVLFGDSHAAHYFPPLEALADEHGWRLVVFARGGCPSFDIVTVSRGSGKPAGWCATWRADAIDRIAEVDPQLVVVANASHYEAYTGDGDPLADQKVANLVAGQRETVARLDAVAPDAEVVVFGASPRLGFVSPECLAANLTDVSRCTPARHEVVDQALVDAQQEQAAADTVGFVDTTRWTCTDDVCPLIVGDLLVYWDTHHLSVPYAMWLQPALERQLFG